MVDKKLFDVGVLMQEIVDVETGATRVAEYMFYTFVN